MFEKEAEEKYCKGCKSRMEQCLWAWRNTNGLNELKNCSCKEVPNYIRGAIDGYNKANEWHYVKDGDLPPLDTNVLVIHRWARTPEVGKRIKVFINSSVWVWAMCSDRFRYTSDDENVIAWKEIVLPKEIEENE